MNSVSYLIAGLMILDKIYRISLTCQKIEQKTVQTSPLFLNQIANFVTVNSEKTLNLCQITKIYFKLGKVAGKLRKDAESCKKMRKVAKRCGKLRKVAKSCGIVKLAKVAISATSATARNSRGCDLYQVSSSSSFDINTYLEEIPAS